MTLISTLPVISVVCVWGIAIWMLIDIYVYPRFMAWVERDEVATEIGFEFSNILQALKSGAEAFGTFATTPRAHINRLNISLGFTVMYMAADITGVSAVISAETLHMVLKKCGQFKANHALDSSDMHSLCNNHREFADDGFGLVLPAKLCDYFNTS